MEVNHGELFRPDGAAIIQHFDCFSLNESLGPNRNTAKRMKRRVVNTGCRLKSLKGWHVSRRPSVSTKGRGRKSERRIIQKIMKRRHVVLRKSIGSEKSGQQLQEGIPPLDKRCGMSSRIRNEENYAEGTWARSFPTNVLGIHLLIIPFLKNVIFVGSLQFRVVLGECKIFGFKAVPSTKEKWIEACSYYCGSALMYFESDSVVIPSYELADLLSQFGIMDFALPFQIGAVLLVRSAVPKQLPFQQSEIIEMFYGSEDTLKKGTTIVPTAMILNTPCENLLFFPSMDMKLVSRNILQEYTQLGQQKLYTVLACGAAGVGKSTFLRFVINGLLSAGVQPFLMELDTGQSEFCLPGCLAIKRIELPLIGPPFGRSMNEPQLCYYFGEASPDERSQGYLQLISELFLRCKEGVRNGILLVNTNGFVVGIGADILAQIVRILKPDRIVLLTNTIECRDDDDPTELRELLEPFSNLWLLRTVHCRLGTKGTINNTRMRDIQTASYMLRNCSCLKQFYSKIPFMVSWNKLYVGTVGQAIKQEYLLYALNGCLVALCNVPKNSAQVDAPSHYFGDQSWPMILPSNCIPRFIAFGLLRYTDIHRKRFYLLSPLSILEIQYANCILLGDAGIPRYMYFAQTTFLDSPLNPELELERPTLFPKTVERLSAQMWKTNTFRSRNYRITESAKVQRKVRPVKALLNAGKG